VTNDPQWPSNSEPPEQGQQQPPNMQEGSQGGGQERGSRGGEQPAGGQREVPSDRGSDEEQPREVRQEPYRTSQPEHGSHAVGGEPEHKSHLGRFIALGVIGLLALGGLIGGLVAAFAGPAATAAHHSHVPSVTTHVPTTHVPTSVSPTTTPSPSSSTAAIKTFQYVGPRVSGGFAAPAAVTSRYIYRCPAPKPGAGPFMAKMENANGSDSQTIANTSGPGGTGTVVLHPRHPGSTYHLNVSTKCEYRIQLYK
jgi:hypothetical protein